MKYTVNLQYQIWENTELIIKAKDPEEAVEKAIELVTSYGAEHVIVGDVS